MKFQNNDSAQEGRAKTPSFQKHWGIVSASSDLISQLKLSLAKRRFIWISWDVVGLETISDNFHWRLVSKSTDCALIYLVIGLFDSC